MGSCSSLGGFNVLKCSAPFLARLNIYLPGDPIITLLGIYPREMEA
jgi:hypothetical protein